MVRVRHCSCPSVRSTYKIPCVVVCVSRATFKITLVDVFNQIVCQGRASKCVEAEPLTVGFLASSQCSAAPNYLPPLAFLFYDGFFLPCSGGSSELSGCVMRHAVIRCSHTIPPYLAHCTTQHHTAPHSGRGGEGKRELARLTPRER